jgi:hypothetical protein
LRGFDIKRVNALHSHVSHEATSDGAMQSPAGSKEFSWILRKRRNQAVEKRLRCSKCGKKCCQIPGAIQDPRVARALPMESGKSCRDFWQQNQVDSEAGKISVDAQYGS